MSIDTEIKSLLSKEDAVHFAARTEAVTTAMQEVRDMHWAYSWLGTDEIRCRGCNASLEIPLLSSTKANANKAFDAHRETVFNALLAADGATRSF